MADRIQLEYLKNPFFDWNLWRQKHKPAIDFIGSKLFNLNSTKRDLSYGNFSDATFDKVDLSACNLENSNFEASLISNSKIMAAKAVNAVFFDTVIVHSDFSDSDFTKCNFEKARFQHVKIHQAILLKANLKSVSLTNCVFENTSFKSSVLKRIKCQQSSFKKCVITDQEIKRCEFNKVDFSQSNLENSSFNGCILQNCSFENANVANLSFSQTALSNVDFSKSYGFDIKMLDNCINQGNIIIPNNQQAKSAEEFSIKKTAFQNIKMRNIKNEKREKHSKDAIVRHYSEGYTRLLATEAAYLLKLALRNGLNQNNLKNQLVKIGDCLDVIKSATDADYDEKPNGEKTAFDEARDVLLEQLDRFVQHIESDVKQHSVSDFLLIPGVLVVVLTLSELACSLGSKDIIHKYYQIAKNINY